MQALNFTGSGWQKAKEHVLQAVKADGAMRFYMADPFCEMGLLFKCHQARVELEHPAGEAPQWRCVAWRKS